MAGIYVHIPFCHSKCAYCDFYSVASSKRVEEFADAIAREWKARRCELGDSAVSTLYFGGGTPSILPAEVFCRIASLFPADDAVEFTIEVNPEDVDAQSVAEWSRAGVNRVSMGVQSLVDAELAAVGRRHSAGDALNAIKILKEGGVDNISCDLIYGLPGQTTESWAYSVERILEADIQHLSAYCLSYEPGTRLYLKLTRGELAETADETLAAMYGHLCRKASEKGFGHYEISNFGLPARHSLHNSSYWNLTPYLGLGPGAHSLDVRGIRRMVPPSLKSYLQSPETAAVIDEESDVDRLNDLLFISLRTAAGLPLSLLPSDRLDCLLKAAAPFIAAGTLVRSGDSLFIPENHWLISDSIIRELFFE